MSGEKRIATVRPGGGKMSTVARLNSARIWLSARRTVAVEATIFGLTSMPSSLPYAECFERRLVQPDHRAERTRDQVQLILDDQVRRQQPSAGYGCALRRVARPVETGLGVIAVDPPEERAHLARPTAAPANLSTVAMMKHGRRR